MYYLCIAAAPSFAGLSRLSAGCREPRAGEGSPAGRLASVPGAEALSALFLQRQPLPGVFLKRWRPSVLRSPPHAGVPCQAHGTGACVGQHLGLTRSPVPISREDSLVAAVKPSGKACQLTATVPEQCQFSTAWRVTDKVLEGCNHHPSCLL